ncbi:MAG: hypothetical protein JWM20_815 [Patescibacteria group bacterium]|nr:hypothetical protein [Patescibacteria group bacterium]
MGTVEAVAEKPQDILSKFIAEKHSNSRQEKIARIRISTDLVEIRRYLYSDELDPDVRLEARRRTYEWIREILPTIEDTAYLANLYSKHVWSVREIAAVVLGRMTELYAKVSDIEEMIRLKKELPTGFEGTTEYVMYPAIERICELIVNDDRRTSYPFLIKAWWAVLGSVPFVNDKYSGQIEKLLPEALASENDIKVLLDYRGNTFNSWNHTDHGAARAIDARINGIIEECLPNADSFEKVAYYKSTAKSNSLCLKAEDKMAELALSVITPMKSMDEVLESRLKIHFGSSSFGSTEAYKKAHEVFKAKIDELLPGFLSGFKSADQVYPYVKSMKFHFVGSAPNLIESKFAELAPAYFQKDGTLEILLKWYGQHDTWEGANMKAILKGIAIEMIPKETNPESLMRISENDKNVFPLAQARLAELLSQLSEPADWFLSCLQKKKFFGNEGLFYEKAKQFVKAV